MLRIVVLTIFASLLIGANCTIRGGVSKPEASEIANEAGRSSAEASPSLRKLALNFTFPTLFPFPAFNFPGLNSLLPNSTQGFPSLNQLLPNVTAKLSTIPTFPPLPVNISSIPTLFPKPILPATMPTLIPSLFDCNRPPRNCTTGDLICEGQKLIESAKAAALCNNSTSTNTTKLI